MEIEPKFDDIKVDFAEEQINDQDLFHSVGLYSKEEINYAKFNQFSRFGRLLDTYGRLNSGREYLFFVKPDLHICVPKEPDNSVYDWGTIKDSDKDNPDWSAKWPNDVNDSTTGNYNYAHNETGLATEQEKEGFFKRMFGGGGEANPNTIDTRQYSIYQARPSTDDGLVINPQLDFDGYFQWLIQYKPNIVRQIQYSVGPDGNTYNGSSPGYYANSRRYNPFCYLLSSTVNSNLSLSSSQAKTMDNPSNIFGTTYNYLQDSEAADESNTFSLEFMDNKHLDVYHFFRAYSHYHNLRKYGTITPPHSDYYKYRRLHNTMGIYKFIVAEDMETLIYWAYFWGVFPMNCPREAFQDATFSDGLTFSIDFEAAFIEDMDPRLLLQFNRLMKYVMGEPTDRKNYKWDNWEELPITKQNYSSTERGYDPSIPTDTRNHLANKTASSIIDGRLPSAAQVLFKDANVPGNEKMPESQFKLKWYVPKNSPQQPKFNMIDLDTKQDKSLERK